MKLGGMLLAYDENEALDLEEDDPSRWIHQQFAEKSSKAPPNHQGVRN